MFDPLAGFLNVKSAKNVQNCSNIGIRDEIQYFGCRVHAQWSQNPNISFFLGFSGSVGVLDVI